MYLYVNKTQIFSPNFLSMNKPNQQNFKKKYLCNVYLKDHIQIFKKEKAIVNLVCCCNAILVNSSLPLLSYLFILMLESFNLFRNIIFCFSTLLSLQRRHTYLAFLAHTYTLFLLRKEHLPTTKQAGTFLSLNSWDNFALKHKVDPAQISRFVIPSYASGKQINRGWNLSLGMGDGVMYCFHHTVFILDYTQTFLQ